MKKGLFATNVLLLGFCLFLDQWTKRFFLQLDSSWFEHDWSIFSIILRASLNVRFAFSIPAHPTFILFVVCTVLFGVILFWGRQIHKGSYLSFWLSLIIAGAIGNLIDRLAIGGVIDWIEFSIGTFSWSSFNFADAFILIGVLGWIAQTSLKSKK